jgi:hypothetical protein
MRIRPFLPALVGTTFLAGSCFQEVTDPSAEPQAALVSAGWSFGLCIGPCQAELKPASTSELVYEVRDRTGATVYARNRGQLTVIGAARLASVLSALPSSLPSTFGCPDCADGGRAFFTLSRGGATQRVEYEYPNPPSEVAALDGILKGVMEALGTCRPNFDVILSGSCTPIPR